MLNKYEGMFIFPTSLKDEALEGVRKRIDEEIKGQGGAIGESNLIGRRAFARPMGKRNGGVYCKLWFWLPAENMAKLQKRFKLVEGIFRVQIVCAGDEDSVAEKAAAGEEG